MTFSSSRPSWRHDGEALRRERLVELHEIELSRTVDARPVEELVRRRESARGPSAQVDTGNGGADERAEWLDPELTSPLLTCDHEHSGT